MKKVKEEKEEAYEYLNEISHTLWSQYAFPAPRFGHITSNIAESMNSSWDEFRKLPILRLFTCTWTKTMTTMHLRRHRPHHSNQITDYAQGQITKNYQQARRYKVENARKELAHVFIPDGSSYIVDLGEKECSCGEFQEYLIPCRHAIAACLWQGEDPYDYVHDWYSIAAYRATYAHHMHPIREEDLVEENSDCGTPQLSKQCGRPKKLRYRREREERRAIVCSHCKEKGHNRRSCCNAAAQE